MSPQSLRRFRAERLLRRDFDALRPKVLSTVRSRLGGSACELDTADLEACYAQAWQGLYAAVLGGEEIENPAGWLVVVTTRRAVDERRARHEAARAPQVEAEALGFEPELEARIDDLGTLRQLFEGLRGGLAQRELEAATLCYLQGFSRAEAAQRMGLSAKRLGKLMEGDTRAGGVASKVGELLAVIRAEAWCEEQGSTMRAFAFGILDPSGERYRLALAHQRECSRCRRYVRSLRGLAAALPPPVISLRIAAVAGGGAGTATGTAGALATGAAAGSAGGWPLGGTLVAKVLAAGVALSLAAGGALVLSGARRSTAARESGDRAPAIGVSGQAIERVAAEAARSAATPTAASPRERVAASGSRTREVARSARRASGHTARRVIAPLEFGIEAHAPRPTRGYEAAGVRAAARSSANNARRDGGAGEFSFE